LPLEKMLQNGVFYLSFWSSFVFVSLVLLDPVKGDPMTRRQVSALVPGFGGNHVRGYPALGEALQLAFHTIPGFGGKDEASAADTRKIWKVLDPVGVTFSAPKTIPGYENIDSFEGEDTGLRGKFPPDATARQARG
jgi:hypothetical protein